MLRTVALDPKQNTEAMAVLGLESDGKRNMEAHLQDIFDTHRTLLGGNTFAHKCPQFDLIFLLAVQTPINLITSSTPRLNSSLQFP